MIAFEVSVDGGKRCVAGIQDVGVVSLIASRVRRAAVDPASGRPIPGQVEEELTLDVGGLEHDPDGAPVNVRWLRQSLEVGQRIILTVVDAAEADSPEHRERQDPAWTQQRKREYYERLKREFGDA